MLLTVIKLSYIDIVFTFDLSKLNLYLISYGVVNIYVLDAYNVYSNNVLIFFIKNYIKFVILLILFFSSYKFFNNISKLLLVIL